MEKTLKGVIIGRITILIFLLVIIGLFNVPPLFIEDTSEYSDYFLFVSFMNDSFLLLVLIGILGIISGIFWSIKFPYRILAPLIGGLLAIFSVEFIYRLALFLEESFINSGFDIGLREYYLYIFIFAFVIGGIVVFNNLRRIIEKEISLEGIQKQRE